MAKVKEKRVPLVAQLIHEMDDKNRHRLLIIRQDEDVEHSAWFENYELGHYKGYMFCSWGHQDANNLGVGVFKPHRMPVKGLGPKKYSQAVPATPTVQEKFD